MKPSLAIKNTTLNKKSIAFAEQKLSGRRGYRDIAAPSEESSEFDLKKHAEIGNQPAFGFP